MINSISKRAKNITFNWRGRLEMGEDLFLLKQHLCDPTDYKKQYLNEKWLLSLLNELNAKWQLNYVVDVGANIGQTILKIKSVNPKAEIVAFEPNQFCAPFLNALIRRNNFEDVELNYLALGRNDEVVTFFRNTQNRTDTMATTVTGFRSSPKPQKSLAVHQVSLDSFLSGRNMHIDLIKIDVEGGERAALEGMMKSLEKYRPVLIIEILPAYDEKNHARIQNQERIAEIANELGYEIYQIRLDPEHSFKNLKSFPIDNKVENSNYLFIHPESKWSNIINE